MLVNKLVLALAPVEECLSRHEQWLKTYAGREEKGQREGPVQGVSQGLGLGSGLAQGPGLDVDWVASVLYGSTDPEFYPSYNDFLGTGEEGGETAPGPGLGLESAPGLGLGQREVGVAYMTEGYSSNNSCYQIDQWERFHSELIQLSDCLIVEFDLTPSAIYGPLPDR